jgi:hypothetical protein
MTAVERDWMRRVRVEFVGGGLDGGSDWLDVRAVQVIRDPVYGDYLVFARPDGTLIARHAPQQQP